jgi:hypothetical protein
MRTLLVVAMWLKAHWVSLFSLLGMTQLLNPTTTTETCQSFGAWTPQGFAELAAMDYLLSATPLTGTADTVALAGLASTSFSIDSTSADAIVLTAPNSGSPNAGGDSGKTYLFMSGTAFAHTITATGLLQTGAAGTSVLTFAAHAGACVLLRAHQGKLQVMYLNGVTVSS